MDIALDEVKERLLAGAWQVVEAGRFRDLTVGAVAAASHVSRSAVYRPFRGKDELVDALVGWACDWVERDLDALGRAGSPLVAWTDAAARFAMDRPRRMILAPADVEGAAGERLAEARSRLAATAELALRDAVDAGALPLAGAVLAQGVEGAVVAAARGASTLPRDAVVRRAASWVLRAWL